MSLRMLGAVPSLEPNSEYVPLGIAVLCVDCDAIYNVARPACPSCGGGSGLPLAQVLSDKGRDELVEGLRALSKLMAWAKRPRREP